MKFDDSQVGWASNTIYFEGDELIESSEPKPCSICGELCEWISISLEAYYCSEECNRKGWQGLWNALKQ